MDIRKFTVIERKEKVLAFTRANLNTFRDILTNCVWNVILKKKKNYNNIAWKPLPSKRNTSLEKPVPPDNRKIIINTEKQTNNH